MPFLNPEERRQADATAVRQWQLSQRTEAETADLSDAIRMWQDAFMSLMSPQPADPIFDHPLDVKFLNLLNISAT